jgi:hypothetical protein
LFRCLTDRETAMNLTTALLKGVIRGAELPGDPVTSLLHKVDGNTGLFAGTMAGSAW